MLTRADLSAGLLVAMTLGAGIPSRAAAPQPHLGTDAQRQAGQKVFLQYCAQCHGEKGDGNGVAAARLDPRPRDFTKGKFKVRSTPTGALPTDEDLRRVIRDGVGFPYTAMTPFPNLSDEQVTDVIAYIKTFSPKWREPQAYAEPVALPDPPADSDAAAEAGFEIYTQTGCARCHGKLGRGDGPSAPTLVDDWGHPIRPADLTRPWTFRGGATRRDVFRTISTGFYGTPMAGFESGLSAEQRWKIADWIVSHGDQKAAPYADLVTAHAVGAELDELGPDADAAAVRKVFAAAPQVLFPVIGQVVQPGRDFHPAATAIAARAVFDDKTIAILLTWHDMTADTAGRNAPDLEVPRFEEKAAAATEGAAGSFWGEEATPPAPPPPPDGGGFWETGSTAPAPAAAASAGKFSDAVAIQLPSELRPGVAKPYFLMGDGQYPVDLWFVDLAQPSAGRIYRARGSDQLEPLDAEPPTVVAHFEDGEWAVVFKAPRKPATGPVFTESTFVPIAFSVWDGRSDERGNRRGLTRWVYLYLEPENAPSPLVPMLKAAFLVLAAELLLILLVRRRARRAPTTSN